MVPSFNPRSLGIECSFQDGLSLAGRHGFGGYDFAMLKLQSWAAAHGAAALPEQFAALRPGCWNLPFFPPTDEGEGLKALSAQARLAQSIGAVRAAMWILPSSDELPFAENFALHVARYRPVTALLADHGIRLGLEFVGPRTSRRGRYPFVHDLAGVLELCDATGAGLLLDSWHWYTSGGTVAELQRLSVDQVVHVQVNDAPAGLARDAQIDHQRRLPGATGVIDLAGFLGALAGYAGPVTAEPFDAEVNALGAEEAAAATARALFSVLR